MHQLLAQIISLLKAYSFCDAVAWTSRANDTYFGHGRHAECVSITLSLLYPTIYHDTNDKEMDASLLRKAAQVLDRTLRDYAFMRWQFALLKRLFAPPMSAKSVIAAWRESKQSATKSREGAGYAAISQSAYRLYLNALLSEGFCDEFFIESTKLSHQNKGYEIAV